MKPSPPSPLTAAPGPGRPSAGPGQPPGGRRSAALTLCCSLAEVHASLPRRSGPPVYPANSQALHAAVQRPGGSRLGAPGGPGLSERPWACACTRARRPSAQELMAHTLCRCGHEPGRRSGQEAGRGHRKEGGCCWALPDSASRGPCDLEPLGPEASVSPLYLPFQSRGKQHTHKLTRFWRRICWGHGNGTRSPIFFFLFFWPCHMASGVLVSRQGVPCIGSTEA